MTRFLLLLRRPLLACWCLLGCAPPSAPPPPVASPPDAGIELRRPSTFVTEIARSEEAAEALAGQGRALCRALEAGDQAGLTELLTADFRGQLFAGEAKRIAADLVTQSEHPAELRWLKRDAFVARLSTHVQAFTEVQRCSFGVHAIELDEGGAWLWARVSFEVAGLSEAGPVIHRAELSLEASGPELRRLVFGPLQVVSAPKGRFNDVSAQVGVGLRLDPTTEKSIRLRVDEGASLESAGGLAVIDWDRDDRPDLLAYNRHRMFLLYRNDGQGGFQRREGLIPASAVGLFHLFVDLDGDGREELVSTELVGCRAERAWFGLFTRKGEGLVPAGEGLSLAHPCSGHRSVKFQHIAAADVDGDGDLDLAFAGFAGRGSKGEEHNLFEATDGYPNRLFINQGGLKFTEEAGDRGLEGRSFSYVVDPFDVDRDGDHDLYFANDFGPNELFLNDGSGRFTRAAEGPLTANGQSMGITVGDVDGDARLDVYISNMYSKAGHRIVPLIKGQVRPETYETLQGLAAGNSLVRGGGGLTDIGVARARWAWGTTLFDADNDGERELYVLNGNTSHSDARAPDY